MKNILLILLLLIIIYKLLNESQEYFSDELMGHDEIKKHITYGLKTIDTIFNKHNIEYIIAYGTLLGAIRHHEMIPWDDDADLMIHKKDYWKVLELKEEFEKHNLIIETDYKLIKIYFNEKKYPFIDIFLHDIVDDNVYRCYTPTTNVNDKCDVPPKTSENDWWWKWYNFPSSYISERKRFKYGDIELWGPKNPLKVLYFWYGKRCLKECKSASYDHVTSNYVDEKDLSCGKLPKPQI
jgi:phosphorylcholine metabolism protein LicD